MFFRNEGQFYKQIDRSEEGEEIVTHNAQEAKTFWTDVWGQKMEHIQDAMWLKRNQERHEWEEQTGMSTDFAGEAEEDSKLEGPWTRQGLRTLANRFYQLT